jgi:hypothetical protein
MDLTQQKSLRLNSKYICFKIEIVVEISSQLTIVTEG